MNLLLINYEFPPIGGGASTATYHIGKELALIGHEVDILTSSYKKMPCRESHNGMNIFRCPALRKKKSESNIIEMLSFVISAFFLLPFIIKKRKIKGIIVFFGFPCGPLGLWANILFKIPYIISLRGGDVPGNEKKMNKLHRLLKPVRRMIYKKSNAVVANSDGLKNMSIKSDPVPIIVIPNGIDTSYFKPLQKQIEKDHFSFIFVGRLSEQKNLYFVLKQLSILKHEVNIPFIINIVGDGPQKNKLKQFASTLGISDRIHWHGWLSKSQVLKILQESDCFLNPSLYEGMPNAVLEALACGLPVIASNVAGNNTVVLDGENGFLFNLDDSRKLINSLKTIVKDPETRLKMGINAEKRISEKYSWQATSLAYTDIFNHLSEL